MMNNIVKKSGRIFLIVLLVSVYFLDPMVVEAADNTLAGLRSELASLKKQKTDTNNSVNNTQSQINANNQEIANSYASIEQAKVDIEIALNEIEATNIEIEELSATAAELMVLFEQITDNENYLEYATGASSMTELIMRTDAVNQLLDYNNNTITSLEELILTNEQKQLDLISRQEQLNTDIVSYQSKINNLEVDLASFTEISEDIDDQIKNQEALIEYYDDIGCEENEDLDACLARVGNNINNSGFKKPTNYGVVTSLFGYRWLWGSYSFHNAVDIGGNREGTAVYSTTNGTVAAVTYRSSCGGTKVYIHSYVNGEPYTMSYLHLLAAHVSVGDHVTTQTQIGTVGGGTQTWWDNCSTGAHLHYGVATGFYLGGGAHGYSSYSTYVANAINPPGYPGLYGTYKSR